MRGSMESGRRAARRIGENARSENAQTAEQRSLFGLAVRHAPVVLVPLLPLLPALSLAFLASCASEGSRAEESKVPTQQDASKAVELRYRALAKNVSFGLVNESHSNRTELYSERQPIDRATTKVSPDEVVDAIVDYFREQGFFDIAVRGAPPANVAQNASQLLEVALPDGLYHAALRKGVTKEYATTFQTCSKALLDVYNSTMQLQAVEETPDWMNGAPRPATKSKNPGG